MLSWVDDERFTVDDTSFTSSYGMTSTSSSFFIRKHRALVEDLVRLLEPFDRPTVLELGIAAGGSTALLALLAAPRKLVAVELARQPVVALEEFIEAHGLGDVVRTHYGIDQADRERLTTILADELGGTPLDLVIDDASHRLVPSRASFEVIFPHVRTGGLYLIEDWNWQEKLLSPALGRAQQARWLDQIGRAVDEDDEARATFEQSLREALADPSSANHEAVRDRLSQAARGQPAPAPTEDELISMYPELRAEGEAPLLTFILELVLARAAGMDGSSAIAEVTLGPWWTIVKRGPEPLAPGAFRISDVYADANDLLTEKN